MKSASLFKIQFHFALDQKDDDADCDGSFGDDNIENLVDARDASSLSLSKETLNHHYHYIRIQRQINE